MHSNHESQSPTSQPGQSSTGTGAHPTTDAYLQAHLVWLHRMAIASEAMADTRRAQLACDKANPYLDDATRRSSAESVARDIDSHLAAAARHRAVASELERHRGNASACDIEKAGMDPRAVIVVTVERDSIRQHVSLVLGRVYSHSRVWTRLSAGAWSSPQVNLETLEQQLGYELAEYLENLDLPTRVAEMLPRPASTEAAALAAREVAHG